MKRLLGPAMLVVTFSAGCASTHEAEVNYSDNPYLGKGRIQWNSTSLKSHLDIEKALADRTDSGLLRVRMIVRNRTKHDVWVDVRTTFLDEKGFPREQTNWEPICCTARTQTTYQAVSLGSQATDYQVIIRDPRKQAELP